MTPPICQYGACIADAAFHTPMGRLCAPHARRTLRWWIGRLVYRVAA